MELNDITFDATKTEGVWVTYGDAKFLVRSTTSKAYQKAVQRASRRYPAQKVRKCSDTQTAIAVEAAAEALIVDFEGITNNGKAMKNTIENRRILMENPTLREFIADAATDIANFVNGGEAEDTADLKSGAKVAN